MTPRTTGSMVAYHRQFDTIWMEFGRWAIPQYKAVCSGTGTHIDAGRPNTWVQLWADTRGQYNGREGEYLEHFADHFTPVRWWNMLLTMRRQLNYVHYALHREDVLGHYYVPPIQQPEYSDQFIPYLLHVWRQLRNPKHQQRNLLQKPNDFDKWEFILTRAQSYLPINWMGATGGQSTRVTRFVDRVLQEWTIAETYFPDLMKFAYWHSARKVLETFMLRGESQASGAFHYDTTESLEVPEDFNRNERLEVPPDFEEWYANNDDDEPPRAPLPADIVAEGAEYKETLLGALFHDIYPMIDNEDLPKAIVLFQKAAQDTVDLKTYRMANAANPQRFPDPDPPAPPAKGKGVERKKPDDRLF
ncbi:hypothetical protein CALVIDRAFT_569966 [Calocera viscosa TUFC12733]|uniref:Uncharacterized protein n=2 Tax=Calocera viscosa (strain TUFC12733) TaxID=1330018 RepID=A0A167FDK0_CALVF|nr:hypothetical protein CALVIDRAFT_569966 [Calocera viscosa TUFC12733]